jgi:hypothetical protein
MAAVVGLTLDVVTQACEESADGQVVSPANINSDKQVVIARPCGGGGSGERPGQGPRREARGAARRERAFLTARS